MRVTKYDLELNEDRHPILVKEEAVNYDISFDGLSNHNAIGNMLNALYHAKDQAEEHVWLIALNQKNRPLGIFELSKGTATLSIINPREIFIRLLLSGATQFAVAHNHPSGNPMPSSEDVKATNQLKEVGDLMRIPLVDHVIIGEKNNFSLKNAGLI